MLATSMVASADSNAGARRGHGPENNRNDKYENHDRQDHQDHHNHPHGPVFVISPEQVDIIVDYLKSISFDDDKLKVAKLCSQICPLNTHAIGRIAKQFTFDNRRSEFIIFAYEFCVDKENYTLLREVFTFKSEADKVFEKLNISSKFD